MSFTHYTPMQLRTLEALAEYRFLTVKQLVTLGVSKNATSLRDNILKPLASKHRAPIQYQDVGKSIGASYIWSLTAKGAKDLAEMWGVPVSDVLYPKGGVQHGNQYWHRMAQIDFHIQLDLWAGDIGADVLLRHRDYIKTPSPMTGKKEAETKVTLSNSSYIIPDGIFGFRFQKNLYLYALEVHHGTSTQKVVTKLKTYVQALREQAISKKYNYDLSCYVLSVFQEEHIYRDRKLTVAQRHSKNMARCESKMKNVMNRLALDPNFRDVSPAFLFNTMDNIRRDIRLGWKLSDGGEITPF